MSQHALVIPFEKISIGDIAIVGGKNASLGEMTQALVPRGVRVPPGFAITAHAYREFLAHNDLVPRIDTLLNAYAKGAPLDVTGASIRALIEAGEFPPAVQAAITASYEELSARHHEKNVDVAVRSSATAEDLPDASFAGQQESFLNVQGLEQVLDTTRRCFASLFTDRAIVYRTHHGFKHMDVSLSVAVQLMVRSDRGGSGVAFTIDTESGFPNVIIVNAAWGLGENVVKGVVDPDEYRVFKPLLDNPQFRPVLSRRLGAKEVKMVYATDGSRTVNVDTTPVERASYVLDDAKLLELARFCKTIEDHYKRPMDIEWAFDDEDGQIYIVQARSETVQSRSTDSNFRTYKVRGGADPILRGIAIGNTVASGKVQILKSMAEAESFVNGNILVASMTDPDWVPLMKRASGIITDHGGRTSHAAIVSRELGIAAIVGAGNATTALRQGQAITMSVDGQEGTVFDGILPFDETVISLGDLPQTRTEVMLNIADPDAAFRWWRLPAKGIGLARIEFIIDHLIKVHPMALLHLDEVEDPAVRAEIEELTKDYGTDRSEYFVDQLAIGVANIAASQYPHPVIVRMSDFKSNEYAGLIGGRQFEPHEENPMIGLRGASRYYHPSYRPAFELECRAIRRARELMGLDNVVVMIPFCRTLEEADRVIEVMASEGLERGKAGLQLYVMAEIPSNIILAEQFAERFDGFSIGSNDLTQLTLGVDRDSAQLADLFDERNPAVTESIRVLIERAHKCGAHVGICGQAPSDHPEFARFLVECGIDAISVNPDSVVGVLHEVAAAEADREGR